MISILVAEAFANSGAVELLPTSASAVGPWLAGGTASLFIILFAIKWVWNDRDKLKEAEEESDKKFKNKIREEMDSLDKNHQELLSKFNILEVKYGEHTGAVVERRRQIDAQIKDMEKVLQGMMVVKAKEIAEFDTKINELKRQVEKMEDRWEKHRSEK